LDLLWQGGPNSGDGDADAGSGKVVRCAEGNLQGLSAIRQFLIYLLTLSFGVLLVWGVAVTIGWIIPVVKVPVFLGLSVWWVWFAWQYARAREGALGKD
jgi:hypothetical protein